MGKWSNGASGEGMGRRVCAVAWRGRRNGGGWSRSKRMGVRGREVKDRGNGHTCCAP